MLFEVVKAHTLSLARIQTRPEEFGSSDSEICSRCHQDVEWSNISVNGLYSKTGVDWLIAAAINFSSMSVLRFADLEGLPSNNTMGPVNARSLQDVKLNHDEGN